MHGDSKTDKIEKSKNIDVFIRKQLTVIKLCEQITVQYNNALT